MVTQREELILHLPICTPPSSQVQEDEQRADRISLQRTKPDSKSPFFLFFTLEYPVFFSFLYLTPLFYVPLSFVVTLKASLHTHRNTGTHTAYWELMELQQPGAFCCILDAVQVSALRPMTVKRCSCSSPQLCHVMQQWSTDPFFFSSSTLASGHHQTQSHNYCRTRVDRKRTSGAVPQVKGIDSGGVRV